MTNRVRKVLLEKKTTIATILLAIGLIGVADFVIVGPGDLYIYALSVKIFAVLLLSYALIFSGEPSKNRHDFLMRFVQVSIPLLVLAALILMWVRPEFAVWLGAEDQGLEILQPILLLISSSIFLLVLLLLLVKRYFLGAFIALIAALVLLVMGMEEISWMQRILTIESSEFFMQHNMQQETNLHNLSSGLFNILYLCAAFIFLTVIPYYRQAIERVLATLNQSKVAVFIPGRWLFLAFAATVGLVNDSSGVVIWLLFIIAFTIMLLAKEAWGYFKKRNQLLGIWCILLIILIVISYITTVLGPVGSIHSHASFEFREAFMTVGIFAYAAGVYVKSLEYRKHIKSRNRKGRQ